MAAPVSGSNYPYQIRPARAEDQAVIRALIHQVGINPLGLEWPRFLVAVSPPNELVGCGQIKPHRDDSLELASIAVRQDWQGRGVGSALIERLIASQPGPLYLTCRAHLGSYYRRFGFRTVEADEMPGYFRWVHRLFRLLRALGPVNEDLLVMMREEKQ